METILSSKVIDTIARAAKMYTRTLVNLVSNDIVKTLILELLEILPPRTIILILAIFIVSRYLKKLNFSRWTPQKEVSSLQSRYTDESSFSKLLQNYPLVYNLEFELNEDIIRMMEEPIYQTGLDYKSIDRFNVSVMAVYHLGMYYLNYADTLFEANISMNKDENESRIQVKRVMSKTPFRSIQIFNQFKGYSISNLICMNFETLCRKRHDHGARTILAYMNFLNAVRYREFIVIAGEPGSGKTDMANHIACLYGERIYKRELFSETGKGLVYIDDAEKDATVSQVIEYLREHLEESFHPKYLEEARNILNILPRTNIEPYLCTRSPDGWGDDGDHDNYEFRSHPVRGRESGRIYNRGRSIITCKLEPVDNKEPVREPTDYKKIISDFIINLHRNYGSVSDEHPTICTMNDTSILKLLSMTSIGSNTRDSFDRRIRYFTLNALSFDVIRDIILDDKLPDTTPMTIDYHIQFCHSLLEQSTEPIKIEFVKWIPSCSVGEYKLVAHKIFDS